MKHVIAVLALLAPAPAVASGLGSITCTQVRSVMNDVDNRRPTALAIIAEVKAQFAFDDAALASAGHDQVASAWSLEGANKTIALVTSSCADHPSDTLDERADAVFGSIAQLKVDLGVAK